MISAISDRRGFTLIEVLVVLSVVLMLVGISYFSLSGFTEGQSLRSCREEAALVFENARSLAVYSGQKRKVVYDSGTKKIWVEDMAAVKKTDPLKLEKDITIAGPAEFVIRGTGELDGGAAVTYTFTAPRSGRSTTLTIQPKTGKVQKN